MKTKRLLSVLLTLALALGLLAIAPVMASAADIGIVAGGASIAAGNKVYLGQYPQAAYTPASAPGSPAEGTIYTDTDGTRFVRKGSAWYKFEPIQWRVLENGSGGLLLVSDKLLDIKTYHPTYVNMTWENSGMRAFLNGRTTPFANPFNYNFIGWAFNTREQAAIKTTSVANPNNPYYSTPGGNATEDKIFLLSAQEASNSAYFTNDADRVAVRTAFSGGSTGYYWWLRSPGDTQDCAAYVYVDGLVPPFGYRVSAELGVRPALLLNLTSVLFVSDASGASAKSSAAAGGGLSPAKPAGANLKFTFTDSSLALGSVTATSRSGNTVNFSYSGATTGKTLSAVVLRDGAVKYYGKLVASTSASGSASVTLPGDFATATDTVQIFVEECNGDNFSDFASAYKQLAIPTLTSGSVNRTSDTAATIGFTSNLEGTAYYYVQNSGDGAPSAALVKSANQSLGLVTVGTNSGKSVTLTAGAKDIYVVLDAGALSEPLKIQAAAFGGGGGTDPGANYIKLWGKTTKYLSNFGNWLMVIFLFGWIWMAF